MADLYALPRRNASRGQTRLTPEMTVDLAVAILGNMHAPYVISRMQDILGKHRAKRMGPVDMSRNVLRSWVERVCRAYGVPPLVAGLSDTLALACGDASASVTVDRYSRLGGRPMPTPAAQASALAQRYQEAAGYSGVALGWSARSGRLVFDCITPDNLRLFYHSDDPTEPTIIHHLGERTYEGKPVPVVEVYDLTDLAAPFYRVLKEGSEDITEAVHGRTFEGADYVKEWGYADGTPYHRIVVRGHPRHIFDRYQQIEASLIVPIRWTAWGSGTDFSSHPGRNVRGLKLIGEDSSTGEEGTGSADGPEVIKRWVDTDQDKPGDHWQDSPAYDPLINARAVGFYETLTLSLIDLPMQLDASGGEPTAREAEALEERITATLAECRRFDGELLRRAAALANRRPEVPGEGLSEDRYALLYRAEIAEAMAEARDAAETKAEASAAAKMTAAAADPEDPTDIEDPADPGTKTPPTRGNNE